MTSKVFCDLCNVEIEDEENLFKYSLTNHGKKLYFARWDLCKNYSGNLQNACEKLQLQSNLKVSKE